MIEWLRSMFAPRPPDPALARLQAEHAARVAKVPDIVAHAHDVAATVVRESREAEMKAGFARGGKRLGG